MVSPRSNTAPGSAPVSLAQLAARAHAGFPERAGSARLRRARGELARALWNSRGERKLVSGPALDRALAALPPSELAWVFELSPLGPLYLLPTRPFIAELVRTLRALEVTRVLEVAAGDGFLTRCLAQADKNLTVVATDSGAWRAPEARMSPSERRAHRHDEVPGLPLGEHVVRLESRRAVARYQPELVLCSWLPPGSRLLDGLIRAQTRFVLELGAGSGVTASAYSWRFAHEFLEGRLEQTARCRLDARPGQQLHSRATLYYAAQHPEFYEERVQKGDWLHQFKPSHKLT